MRCACAADLGPGPQSAPDAAAARYDTGAWSIAARTLRPSSAAVKGFCSTG